MTIVALLSPFLGAAADYAAAKKKFLAAFLALGVVTTGGLALVGEGDWALGATLFILANIGVTSSLVFYESLLPHICSESEVDRVSSAGYALGYVGGGLAHGAGRDRDREARVVRAHGRGHGHAPLVPAAPRPGGRRSRSRSSGACPSRPPCARRTSTPVRGS